MYILADINEIIENKYLYRNKDVFWRIKWNKKFLFFYIKDFVFNKNICNVYK